MRRAALLILVPGLWAGAARGQVVVDLRALDGLAPAPARLAPIPPPAPPRPKPAPVLRAPVRPWVGALPLPPRPPGVGAAVAVAPPVIAPVIPAGPAGLPPLPAAAPPLPPVPGTALPPAPAKPAVMPSPARPAPAPPPAPLPRPAAKPAAPRLTLAFAPGVSGLDGGQHAAVVGFAHRALVGRIEVLAIVPPGSGDVSGRRIAFARAMAVRAALRAGGIGRGRIIMLVHPLPVHPLPVHRGRRSAMPEAAAPDLVEISAAPQPSAGHAP